MIVHPQSIFVDSGAFTLHGIHVLKRGKRKGKHGRLLEKAPARWMQGDYSFFSLKKGSLFRQYCDDYAELIKQNSGKGILFANVDAIGNPDFTWKTQKYFEQEHNVTPVPVVHTHTSMKYVERYLSEQYEYLGIGGAIQNKSREQYIRWVDRLFIRVCPKSSGYLPIIKLHGFAITNWQLMCRWPWWSVDSTTWLKAAVYGRIMCPVMTNGVFDFHSPPLNIYFSNSDAYSRSKNSHYSNLSHYLKLSVDTWLKYVLPYCSSFAKNLNQLTKSLQETQKARCMANLVYFKDLEESRPEWPYRLDINLVNRSSVDYNRGFDL